MKKILIFEYITGGGLIEKKVENSLLFEAQIILNSFINTSNYDVDFFVIIDIALKTEKVQLWYLNITLRYCITAIL